MRTFHKSCVILDKYWLIVWVGTGEAITSSSIQHQLLTPSPPKNKRWVSGKTEMSKTSHGIRRMDGTRQAQKYNRRWSTTKTNCRQPPPSEPLFDLLPVFTRGYIIKNTSSSYTWCVLSPYKNRITLYIFYCHPSIFTHFEQFHLF